MFKNEQEEHDLEQLKHWLILCPSRNMKANSDKHWVDTGTTVTFGPPPFDANNETLRNWPQDRCIGCCIKGQCKKDLVTK